VSPIKLSDRYHLHVAMDRATGYTAFLFFALAFPVLYIVSRYNYNLFHGLADIFTIVIASIVFVVAWNSRESIDNNYFLYAGIGFLFFALLDLFHVLGNKDMGVLPQYGNLGPTLYIASRYVLSISLVTAPLFVNRKLRVAPVFATYSLGTLLVLLSIFYWQNFPACYVEGVGLTTFKVTSDYIICLILLGALVLLLLNRRSFDARVLRLLAASIVMSIATGLAFTLYADPFGVMNAIGHFFQIISFYLVYLAVIETGLTKPQNILFRKLQQSEERFKLSMEATNDGLWDWDAWTDQVYYSPSYYRILGYEPGNFPVTLDASKTLVHPDDLARTVQTNMDCVEGRTESFAVEYRMKARTGEWRWIFGRGKCITRDAQGRATRLVGTVEDITERKRAEEELARLASFPRLIPHPVVEVDLSGRPQYLNSAAERLLPDLRTAGSSHPWLANFKLAVDQFRNQSESIIREVRIGDFWYQQTMYYVEGIKRVRIYGLDITGRKRAEEALRESEERLRAMLDGSPDPIFLKDRESRLLLANPATYALIGKPATACLGKTDEQFYDHPADGRAIMANDRRIMASGQTEIVEETVNTPSGPRHYLTTKAPYRDAAGNIIGLIGVGRDITEHKRMEEELRRSRDELEMRVQERTEEARNTSLYARSLIEASLDPLMTMCVVSDGWTNRSKV
jgi:PAS domain S-box-containing protein